jgi:hypothetical protein
MAFFSGTNTEISGGGMPSLSGSGAPGSALGVDGQLYIDMTNNVLYGPKAAGQWGTGIALTGASWAELTGKPSTFAPSAHQHPISDVTSLQSSLDGKAASAHAHAISSVTGLQAAIDGKAATVHQHAIADVSGLQTALDAKQATISSFVSSVAGRNGAVTLTASDVGLGSVSNTTDANKPVSNLQAASDAAVQAFSIQRANHTGTQAISTVTGLQTALDGKQAAGSYATLVGGQIPASMLPSFVDDVVDVGTTLPSVGETGKIYVISAGANANKTFRWSGSVFVEMSPSPGTTTNVPEGSNLYFTNARAAAAAPVQSVAGLTGAVTLTKGNVGLDNVDNTADVNKPVSAAQAAADAVVQSFAIQRANHTGTQLASTISDWATQVVKYAPVTSVNGMTGDVTVSGGSGSFTLPTASDTVLGGIKIGAGLTITNGVVTASGGGGGTSYTLPAATASELGGVKVGTGLSIANGVLSSTGGGGSGEDSLLRSLFVPPAPTNVTASAGNAQATVAWTAPTGVIAQAPVTAYVVQFQPSGGAWETYVTKTISITAQPTNQTASSGSASFAVTAAVTPSGTLRYQWERSDDGGSTFTAVGGATSATLSLTGLTNAVDNNDRYRVVVSSVGAASVTSNEVALTVAASSPPLSLAGTRPSNLASGNTTTGYTLSGAGTAGSPIDLKLGVDHNQDARVWLIVNATGTLNWTVAASSEQGYDGGRLYSHAGPPANHTAQAFNHSPDAGYTAISNWLSGTQTQSGTTAVTAGQHIVLQMVKDSEEQSGSDRVELSAYIS